MAPETADTEFTWPDFVELVNNELVANWGNLVNRTVGFAFRRFDGAVPHPGELDATDEALLEEIRGGFDSVGALYEAVRLKAALQEARRLSQRVNQYLNEKEPWRTVQTDPQTAATTVYVTLQAIDWLKLLWARDPAPQQRTVAPISGIFRAASLAGSIRRPLRTTADHIWCCATTMGAPAESGRRIHCQPDNACGNRRPFSPSWILRSCWVKNRG